MNSIYENHMMSDNLIPVIFHTDEIHHTKKTIIVNWHENIELIYCIEGGGELYINSERFELTPGRICVINPYALHGVNTDGGVKYYCLIIDNEFCQKNGIDITNMKFSESADGEAIKKAYREVIGAYYSPQSDIAYAAALRCAVLNLMVELVRSCVKSDGAGRVKRKTEKRIKDVILYIKQNFAGTITLDEIANCCGVNKYHLSREFKKYTSLTIFEYINAVRCDEAKRLIKNGINVSEAALACGFDNFSYFTRTYKRYMGEVPSKHKI